MYDKPFNPNRPYGEVHGIAPYAFEQDGHFFNSQKQPVDANGTPLPLAPEPVAQAPATETVIIEDPDDDVPADEKPIDLLAWANGDEALKTLPFQTVKAAAAQLLGTDVALPSKEATRKAILAHYGLA